MFTMLTVVAMLIYFFFEQTIGDKIMVVTGKPWWNGRETEILDLTVSPPKKINFYMLLSRSILSLDSALCIMSIH